MIKSIKRYVGNNDYMTFNTVESAKEHERSIILDKYINSYKDLPSNWWSVPYKYTKGISTERTAAEAIKDFIKYYDVIQEEFKKLDAQEIA